MAAPAPLGLQLFPGQIFTVVVPRFFIPTLTVVLNSRLAGFSAGRSIER